MLLNHHILAKKSTDAVLAKFKTGAWCCCGGRGTGFYRTGCDSDFPSPDATFNDAAEDFVVSFEFKPPTETKRGILTGLGQTLAYLNFSDISYLLVPEQVEDFAIADYMKGIFASVIGDKIPVGLISYKNDDPSNVCLSHNVVKTTEHVIVRSPVANSRFWAKHVDMPIPLFHLILHYAYLRKVNGDAEDAFAKCWKERMAPVANLLKLKPMPVRDVNDEVIRTVAGTKELTYFEKTVNAILKLPVGDRKDAMEKMLRNVETGMTGDNMFNSVRKNCIPFMHHVGMIDSQGNLTSDGMKMYHLGIVNGPQSRLFRDYFTRMVLLDGHHIDLIYDLEKLSCEHRGEMGSNGIKAIMLNEYASRGMIKTNPGRCAATSSSTEVCRFLKYEAILWRSLDLMKKSPGRPEFAFDWQRITEVCNLPEL